MARLLQRLGYFPVRRRRLGSGSWRPGPVALGGLAGALKGTFSDQFKVPGTESQAAIELIQRNVPQANADGAIGRVVFAAKPDETLAPSTLATAVKKLGTVPDVASVSDPIVSKDGRI